MAKHKLSNANQKLYFASLYLELIETTEKAEAVINKKAQLLAHQQSCLFHLIGAYQGLMWEVAQVYDIPCKLPISLRQLIENAEKTHQPIGDLEQLNQLESDPDSWLAQMLKLWSEVSSLDPDVTTTRREAANLNAIEVRTWNEADPFSQLSDWYGKLKNLAENLRDLLVEW